MVRTRAAHPHLLAATLRSAVALTASLALLGSLAACGGGDDDTTTGTSTSQTAGADDDTGDGGSASSDLVAWADEVCGHLTPAYEQSQSFNEPSDATEPADVLAGLQQSMADLGGAFTEAGDDIAAMDAAPVDDGAELRDAVVDLLRRSGDSFSQMADRLAGLDFTDPDAMAEYSEAMSTFGDEFEGASAELEERLDEAELKAAFEEAPACAAIGGLGLS